MVLRSYVGPYITLVSCGLIYNMIMNVHRFTNVKEVAYLEKHGGCDRSDGKVTFRLFGGNYSPSLKAEEKAPRI